MEQLIQSIQELPGPGLIPVVLLLLVGLVLWAVGRRVLRTGFAAAGLVLGGVLGFAAGGLALVTRLNVPAWVFAIVAAVVGAIVFAGAYRLVLAGAIAILLALLAPLAVLTVKGGETVQTALATYTEPIASQTAPDEFDWVEGSPEPAGKEATAGAEESPPASETAAETLHEWWGKTVEIVVALVDSIRENTPEPLRWTVLAAAAVGGLLGLVIGAAAPSISAAVVTALGGSVIMLSSGLVLATHVGLSRASWTPTTPTNLLIWWLALAVIGLGVQWILRARRADKPAS